MQNIYDKVLLGSDVDFNKVRDGRRAPFGFYDVDLSTERSIAAGTQLVLDPIAGDSFYADLDPVNQGDAIVTFQDTNLSAHGSPVYITRGHIVYQPFTKLLIENAAQPGKRLRFFYGVGADFRPGASSSVNVSGVVEVVDSSKARTEQSAANGSAFLGVTTNVGANKPACQLWNPLGSGKNVFLESIILSSTVATGIDFGPYTTALLNASTAFGQKDFTTGAWGAGQTRNENSAAALMSRSQLGSYCAVNEPVVVAFKEPILLRPGTGAVAQGNAAGAGLIATFEWFEESA
jgi:hypothetical protein